MYFQANALVHSFYKGLKRHLSQSHWTVKHIHVHLPAELRPEGSPAWQAEGDRRLESSEVAQMAKYAKAN